MTTTGKNIIQKQTLDFNFNGTVADAFLFQKEISDWCRHDLAEEVESSISSLQTKNLVRLDKLVVDININQQQWKIGLAEQIGKQIKEKLQSKISALPAVENSALYTENNFFELMKFYLEKGHLPWWSTINSKHEFETKLNEWLQEDLNGSLFLPLLDDSNIRSRIAVEFSSGSFALLIAELIKSQPEKINNILQDVLKLSADVLPASVKNAEYKFRMIFLEKVLVSTQKNILKESLETWLQQIMPAAKSADKKYFSQLQSDEFINALDEFKVADKPNIEEPVISDRKQTEIKKNDKQVSDESIYINNAGLVIVANFLLSFFKRLSVADNYMIKDIDTAVCLTNFLAKGIEDMAEFELVFPKILCGVQPEFVINTNIEIGDAAKQESENLLASIIEHWAILKNTSAEGLRQSFLQRNGKLSFKNNEWLLQVEQQPYDMLLESLPWNISMIRLPWMPHILRTEWIN